MKQVKIIDQALGQGKPAYDLMIPTTWQFKGWVNIGAAEGGCFADWFAVVGDAKSADNSIELQMLPQYTWQYIDDPAGQRQMQMQNQKDAQFGMKPCPVRAPIPAADFLRQDLIAKYRKGKTVVSVEPFPELDQIVRHRLGLPPTAAGGTGRDSDGCRPRAALLRRRQRSTRRGMDYRRHRCARLSPSAAAAQPTIGTLLWSCFTARPKGKLDSNDRLFKLMASTIHPEPEWQKLSNGIIAGLYQKKQEELAKQAAITRGVSAARGRHHQRRRREQRGRRQPCRLWRESDHPQRADLPRSFDGVHVRAQQPVRPRLAEWHEPVCHERRPDL